jgi:hypothetical protein
VSDDDDEMRDNSFRLPEGNKDKISIVCHLFARFA